MAQNYYYLVSSLPYLRFEKEIAISRSDFISECGKWLSDGDFGVIQRIDVNDIQIGPQDLELVKEWKEFNKDLKEDLARARAVKKTRSQEKVSSVYKEVFEENTPLLMERRMENIRWNFVDQFELHYDFDINRLILYFLKLQILERVSVFNKEEGKKIFNEICEVIHKENEKI